MKKLTEKEKLVNFWCEIVRKAYHMRNMTWRRQSTPLLRKALLALTDEQLEAKLESWKADPAIRAAKKLVDKRNQLH